MDSVAVLRTVYHPVFVIQW